MAMLLLELHVAGQPYAVEATRVVEVVPRLDLRLLPHAPEELAGLLRYRRQMVPVIDLGIVLGNAPCPRLLSTRIVLVDDQSPARSLPVLGLIAAQVSDVRTVADDQVIPPPSLLGQNAYLGPIISTGGGLIPLIAIERLLAEPLRRSLAEALP
jgi:chemotaxis-related protein WspB